MRQLRWDQQELFEFLCIQPEFEEFYSSYTYTVIRAGLRLKLTIWQDESIVGISIYQEHSEQYLVNLDFFVRGQLERRLEKWGESLRLTDCVLIPPGRISSEAMEENLLDPKVYPYQLTAEIAVHPLIKFEVRSIT